MRLPPATFLACCCAAALALPAAAVETPPAPASVQHSYAKEAFQPWSIDTGWWPQEGPVQVRFIGFVGGGMRARCDGNAHLSWPESRLWADAPASAGDLSMDMGVELQTYLHLELDLPFGPHVSWEGPIPVFPGFDYRFAGNNAFTPYLLAGQPATSVVVSDFIQQTELYSLSLTDQIIPIPGIEGTLEVSAGGLLDLAMRGKRLTFPEGEVLQHLGTVPAAAMAGAPYQTSVGYEADVSYQGSLLLEPAVVIHIGPLEWDLVSFELPYPLPPIQETWTFPAQPVQFQVPGDGTPPDAGNPPPDAGMPEPDAGMPPGPDAGTPPGPDAGNPPGPDAGTPRPDAGVSNPDAGSTPGDPEDPPDEGCGCSGGGATVPFALLGLLAMVVARRIRNRPSP
jgi:uncharacterized protein (TIGR03382 family)